jgi:hypothetical protein
MKEDRNLHKEMQIKQKWKTQGRDQHQNGNNKVTGDLIVVEDIQRENIIVKRQP